jgi:hypothetical protein
MHPDASPRRAEQTHPVAIQVLAHLLHFLALLLATLDYQLHRRLVVTFVETLQALLVWRIGKRPSLDNDQNQSYNYSYDLGYPKYIF